MINKTIRYIEIGDNKFKLIKNSFGEELITEFDNDDYIYIDNDKKEYIVDMSSKEYTILGCKVANVKTGIDAHMWQECRWCLVDLNTMKEFDGRVRNTNNDIIWSINYQNKINHQESNNYIQVSVLEGKQYFLNDDREKDIFKTYFINTNTLQQLRIDGTNKYIREVGEENKIGGINYLQIKDSEWSSYVISKNNLIPLKVTGTDKVISYIYWEDKKYRFGKEYIKVGILQKKINYYEDIYINSETLEEMPFYLQII